MTAFGKLFRTTPFRLSLIYLLLFGIAAALAIGYIYWNMIVLLARQLEQTIQAEVQGLNEQYNQGGLTRLVQTIAERSRTPGNSLYLVTDRHGLHIAGNLRYVSHELWNTVGRVEFSYHRSNPESGSKDSRLGVATVFRLTGGFRLIVGRDIEERREFQRVIGSAVLWGLSVMILFGLGGGWLVSRNLLSRIDVITAASQTIMKGDLSERIPVKGTGDELDRLSANLNVMLERIERLMAELREVSDNIAHDLKTPLNRMRNRVEGALRESGNEADYREALEKTIEESDELIKTFNALLNIAHLEAGSKTETMELIDLAEVIHDVADLYEPVAEEQGFIVSVIAERQIMIPADRQLIGQALANLIDNAIKYARPEKTSSDEDILESGRNVISLKIVPSEGAIELVVADHGPGIPSEKYDYVVKRFARLEASRSRPGSGLGLSLVSAVARLHNGKFQLEDNNPGLKATLRLPVSK